MILFLIARLLLFVVSPIAFAFGVLHTIFSKKRNSRYFVHLAVAIDQLGNVLAAPLFNVTFIKNNGYKFGVIDETISSVLGKNKALGTLNRIGWILCWILNKLEKNHVEKAIENF